MRKKEIKGKQVKNMKTKITKKEVVLASTRKWENIDDMRHETAEYILREWLSQEDTYKGLKHAFPELENLDGSLLVGKVIRWYGKLRKFVNEIAMEVEDFVEFSKEQLGDKICYDQHVDDPLCLYCSNLVMDYREAYCKLYPHMGEMCGEGHEENFHANLIDVRSKAYPWNWCIRFCPDFKYEKNRVSERQEIIKKLTKDRVIEF